MDFWPVSVTLSAIAFIMNAVFALALFRRRRQFFTMPNVAVIMVIVFDLFFVASCLVITPQTGDSIETGTVLCKIQGSMLIGAGSSGLLILACNAIIRYRAIVSEKPMTKGAQKALFCSVVVIAIGGPGFPLMGMTPFVSNNGYFCTPRVGTDDAGVIFYTILGSTLTFVSTNIIATCYWFILRKFKQSSKAVNSSGSQTRQKQVAQGLVMLALCSLIQFLPFMAKISHTVIFGSQTSPRWLDALVVVFVLLGSCASPIIVFRMNLQYRNAVLTVLGLSHDSRMRSVQSTKGTVCDSPQQQRTTQAKYTPSVSRKVVPIVASP